MKYQRVIFHLEDGRKKYATHNGEALKWGESDLKALERNHEWFGGGAYTADFAKYDVTAKALRERYPTAKIVKIVGYEVEVHDQPIRTDVIF